MTCSRNTEEKNLMSGDEKEKTDPHRKREKKKGAEEREPLIL